MSYQPLALASPGSGYVPFGASSPLAASPLSASPAKKAGSARRPLRPHNPPASLRWRSKKPAPRVARPADDQREASNQRLLRELRDDAAEQYEPSRHERLLRSIWERQRFGGEFRSVSPCWVTLGFQCEDPARDLRGCGALGLRQLLFFVERGGSAEVLAAAKFSHAPFPLAAASLSVTLALCSHLQLLPDGASSQPLCAAPTLRCFLRLAAELRPEAPLLDLLHAELLRSLGELWAEMQTAGLTLMHFPEALRHTHAHMAESLAGAAVPWQLSDVLQRLRGLGRDAADAVEHGAMADLCSGGVLSWIGL